MTNFFVPYSGKHPALISVNGHKLLILAREQEVFEDSLDAVGADRLKIIKTSGPFQDEDSLLKTLAEKVDAGVVVAASDSDFQDVLRNLEEELPWVH